MSNDKRYFNQRNILILLLVLLAISLAMNVTFYFWVIRPLKERESEQETGAEWIGGVASEMWDAFSIKLTPNRAVLSLESDRKFNVSVKGLRWAPYDFGSRPFYFKIYNRRIDYPWTIPDEPELLDEETVSASKSKDELDYVIFFNFTVLLDKGGTHIYTIVGATWPDVTLDRWDCIATFALNIV